MYQELAKAKTRNRVINAEIQEITGYEKLTKNETELLKNLDGGLLDSDESLELNSDQNINTVYPEENIESICLSVTFQTSDFDET